MKSVRIDIAGGAQRIWVAADAEGVTLTCPPYWQQRLTHEEAARLADALRQASQALPQPAEHE